MAYTSVVMTRCDVQDLPAYDVPAGYGLRWYRPGDRQAWVDVQTAAEPYLPISGELFDREFGGDEQELARRMCFLCDAGGRAIATGTAWSDAARAGRVHWIAVAPAAQGKGLSKPLLSAVCRRLVELGHERLCLNTANLRLPAIALYLRFGFVPHIRHVADERAWRGVLAQLVTRRQH